MLTLRECILGVIVIGVLAAGAFSIAKADALICKTPRMHKSPLYSLYRTDPEGEGPNAVSVITDFTPEWYSVAYKEGGIMYLFKTMTYCHLVRGNREQEKKMIAEAKRIIGWK